MENIILSGILREFVTRHGFEAESIEDQFEKFSNYCLWKSDHYDSFEFSKVGTGKCIGVDGVAVVISGVIIDDFEDAENLTKGNFDVKFLFSQAKTSASFDAAEFMKFAETVRVFFGRDSNAVPPELKNAFKIKELVYDRTSKLASLPIVGLEYIYSGKYSSDKNVALPLIESQVASVREMRYSFSKVEWRVHDGEAISRLYREAKNDIQKKISFQRHVALPSIGGARAAYIGVVKCMDYVSLIEKDNGDLNKGLFFENVRDFLGAENKVNEEIAKTIKSADERNKFAILNNGVTVVAKKVTPSGDIFDISQFQIVNGCQTSHVLYNNRRDLSDDMYITVKLIETSDINLSGKVITTTNSQSLVTKEAFATIRPYHLGLEDFFDSMRASGYDYYYERRPHQYDDRDDIKQICIISAPLLIKTFISVVMEEPHKVHYYYGRLLQEYNEDKDSELFATTDYPGLYFAAHHIVAKVKEKAGRSMQTKDWVYHIALLIKKQLAPELRRGIAMPDRKFINILEKIDEGFDSAYINAKNAVLSISLRQNDNRLPLVTKNLVENYHRRFSETKAAASARIPSPRLDEIKLKDGRYIGSVSNVNIDGNKVQIGYGPFSVSVALDKFPSQPWIGQRVSFVLENGTVRYVPNV